MKHVTIICLPGYTWSTQCWPSWDEMVSHSPLASRSLRLAGGWVVGVLAAWESGVGAPPREEAGALRGDVEAGPDRFQMSHLGRCRRKEMRRAILEGSAPLPPAASSPQGEGISSHQGTFHPLAALKVLPSKHSPKQRVQVGSLLHVLS